MAFGCASASGDFQVEGDSGSIDGPVRCVPDGMSPELVEAECIARVIGVGSIDVETDYLPRVVACENGNAPTESLKAQAIAARSYLYYRLGVDGMIEDGQSDQVYTCSRMPSSEHRDAVFETSGIVLRYQGVQVAPFYVAGAKQDPPSCVGGTDDVFNTERYVTLNEGRSGSELIQSPLGWVDPTNLANRGCMSQEGANCLASTGRDYRELINYYYGDDIEFVKTVGDCVVDSDECEPKP